MDLDRGAVALSARDGDLELARQEREFRMDARPLSQNFGVRPWICYLIASSPGEVVSRDVANAIARGLERMHLDACQFLQDIRRVGEARPVVLDVLARGEVTVAAVILARDMGEHAHLAARQGAIGNGDAQHIGVKLQIDAVHQAQRLEGVFRKLAAQTALDLIAELFDAGGNEGVVEFIVTVHRVSVPQAACFGPERPL